MSYLGKGIRGGTTPFSVIDIFTGLQKRMEAVYGGDGEKLAVRFFDNDTVSSVIYYNGAFTYVSQGSNPAARTLRDMSTPEGVVTKSGGNYYYKYFLRDYLGNVRDVLSCSKSGGYQEEQFTNYDPLGLAISKIGSDNPYLYNGKELYPDFSDVYDGVYDFGARYYNPLYGRWFAQDPEKQFINPYLYCANNPVMGTDPDGRRVIPTGELKLQQMLVKQLQSAVKNVKISIKDNVLTYTVINPKKKIDSKTKRVTDAIDDKKISVLMELEGLPEIFTEASVIGGAFMGNTYNEANGTAVARQIVSPEFMEKFDAAMNDPGAGAVHELLEAYEGGKAAVKEQRSMPNSSVDEPNYMRFHTKSTYVPNVEYYYLDRTGSEIDNSQNAKFIQFYYKKQIGTGFVPNDIMRGPFKSIKK